MEKIRIGIRIGELIKALTITDKDNREYYNRDKCGKLIPYKEWVKSNPYVPFAK